jgi:oxygen-independent coproporphyrinogen-3 oxidase
MGSMHDNPPVTLELLRRYSRPGPRYTSYPTAPQFHTGYNEADYRARLAAADAAGDEPLSLYVHLPFCRERCHYCGCHVVIARRQEIAGRYLESLFREIDLLAAALPNRRAVSQLHWGGGTPTYHTLDEMRALHGKLTEHFELLPDAEVAIEVDPRVTDAARIDLLRELGFNRISMGVQDFNPQVQEAIGRNQTEEETRRLYEHCVSVGLDSINLDLIYGLPLQTPDGFRRNVETVLDLRPARLALYSYAHLPSVKAHQKRIDAASLPDPETKLELFCVAREMFLDAGYAQIGMDHFVLPDDELALAADRGRLFRNFMGYTVRMGSDMLGLGISAIGDVRASFAQNAKKLSDYYAALDAGRLPIERGYALTEDDRIRRNVITNLMCNFRLDIPALEERFGIDFAAYFAEELDELQAEDGPVAHGFTNVHPDRIEVVGHGRLFVRNVCMIFDGHLREQQARRQIFSSTV